MVASVVLNWRRLKKTRKLARSQAADYADGDGARARARGRGGGAGGRGATTLEFSPCLQETHLDQKHAEPPRVALVRTYQRTDSLSRFASHGPLGSRCWSKETYFEFVKQMRKYQHHGARRRVTNFFIHDSRDPSLLHCLKSVLFVILCTRKSYTFNIHQICVSKHINNRQ